MDKATIINYILSDGLLSKDSVLAACLKYMSSDELKDMFRLNGWDDMLNSYSEDFE